MNNSNKNTERSTLANGFEALLNIVEELSKEAKKAFSEMNIKLPKGKSFSKMSTADKIMIGMIWLVIAMFVAVPNLFWGISFFAGFLLGFNIMNQKRKSKEENSSEDESVIVETVAENVD